MRDAGYRYVNLDAGWAAPTGGADGTLLADPTEFRDGIAAVASYAHDRAANHADQVQAFTAMRNALRARGPPIFYSINPNSSGDHLASVSRSTLPPVDSSDSFCSTLTSSPPPLQSTRLPWGCHVDPATRSVTCGRTPIPPAPAQISRTVAPHDVAMLRISPRCRQP